MTIVIIIILIVAVIIIASHIKPSPIDEETKERRRKIAERFQKESEERELKAKQLELEMSSKYGPCTKSIKWWFDNETDIIRIYEETRTIFLMGEEYKFDDILGVDYIDKVSHSVTTATTKTDSKNLASRALVGGLIAGGLGAAVGAVTAKQQTVYNNNNEAHDYCILVNTKNLSKPLVELRIANNISQVNEIIATLNAVIAYNR